MFWIYCLLIVTMIMCLFNSVVLTAIAMYLVRLNEPPEDEEIIPEGSDTGLIDITTPQITPQP